MKDFMDNRESISLKKRNKKLDPKTKRAGSIKGKIPVYFPEQRMVVYVKKGKSIKKIREKYDALYKKHGSK